MISRRAGSRSDSSKNTAIAPLILASASPRRLALLAQIGVIPDRIAPAGIDETPHRDEIPRLYAQRMAREKARSVAEPGCFTLAADTVVALGRRILPKAASPEDVRTCLAMLSGRRHHVLTALVLVAPGGELSERLSDTSVAFARFSTAQLDAYAQCGEGLGKAGGYAIQGRAAAFARLLTGSYSGVVGLPLFEAAQLLRGRGYRLP